jgi:catechol 2,3-dioxygenase-like lactoylglutathione lyase family enzyme
MNSVPVLHPNGINHLAIATRNMKAQLQFFTDVLGGSVKALYWMHGVAGTFHGFVELSPSCYIAFVQHPGNPDTHERGLTHADGPGGPVAAGIVQHIALNVESLHDLNAMRDRLRDRGIVVLGPMNHGFVQSIYFGGPEGLTLEVATGSDINGDAWIDPEVQALCGISDDELIQLRNPAPFSSDTRVPQPAYDPTKPILYYPPERLDFVLTATDEQMWGMVESDPPVDVNASRTAVGH